MEQPTRADEFDTPWKQVLHAYFPQALAHFFPEAHADIDWAAGHDALDTELQALRPQADTGRRYVDKLVRVRRRDGTPVQVLVHVEVQAARVTDFARRMFEYHTRLMHTYAEPVASFAILADLEPGWRPADYQHALWGCRARFEFPTVKLLDLAPGDPANPFAVVVDAYLRARRTRRDPQARLDAKLTLAKSLYDRGWRRDDVLNLYTFIDWTLRLPLDLAGRFHHDLAKFEEERRMPYVSTAERIGIEKGI
ncbi:MAG: hypothetical protein KC613_22980, partial [Myxococcales bacterium]|nr:hypothetical protein [Myxococcales bacterium]